MARGANRREVPAAVLELGEVARGAGWSGGRDHLRLPHSANPDAMASGAVTAVQRLATANGHQASAANLGAGVSKHRPSSSPVLLFAPILALALIALVAGVMARVRRRRP